MRKLPILCPQLYDGMTMRVTPCTRCSSGWDRKTQRCDIPTGAEHLPPREPPPCPIAERCQHGVQALPGACTVRLAGMVCESALALDGDEAPWDSPLAFHALMME